MRAVAFGLARLSQPVQVARILLVRLPEFRNCSVVLFLRKRDPTGQFVSLLQLSRILRRFRALPEVLQLSLGRVVVLFPDGQ